MSSVFLADVDDYLSPSTACVNPAFANGGGDTTTTTTVPATAPTSATVNASDQPQNQQSKDNGGDIASEGIVRRRPRNPVVRRSGRGVGLSSSTRKPFDTGSNSNKVTASIVDCLACSGCVTTAETVLLKEHSVDKFRDLVRARTRTRRKSTAPTVTVGDMTDDSSMDNIDRMEVDEEDEINDSAQVVITLSIASAAELLRLLRHKRNNIDNSSGSTVHTAGLHLLHRKLVALLCRQLSVNAMLDGQLALEWSLQQSALEFCDRYQLQPHQQQQTTERDAEQLRSDSISNVSTLVSSSCPATVCYVEKTCHAAVPHLSRVMSPMGCARAYLSSTPKQKVNHVAIMPCHDKKLEATRPATTTTSSNSDEAANNQNVLVLTTSDCWQLLLESIDLAGDEEDDDDRAELLLLPSREETLRRLFESLPPSVVDRVKSTQDFEPRRHDIVPNSWITSDDDIDDGGGAINGGDLRGSASSLSLLHTSGGYADYIFRFAAHRMFGIFISQVHWKPVSANALATADDPAVTSSSTSSIRSRPASGAEGRPTTASARVAAARREILEATLYRHEYRRHVPSSLPSDESVVVEYSQHDQPTAAAAFDEGTHGSVSSRVLVSTTPVLRFAMAHGLQVMQRAISSAGSSHGGRYHYVEAMACPSGCLNGGGQILPSAISQDGRREPPSEVKARVESASRNLRVPRRHLPDPSSLLHPPSNSYHQEHLNERLQTSFHAVQPLQLQYGAAKGMAVKDIQW